MSSEPYFSDSTIRLFHGANLDALPHLADGSVDCVVTSPPYFGLRDYGVEGQYGAEETPAEFVANLVATFREVRRVMAHDATLWLNLGDSYAQSGKSGPQGSTGQRADRTFTAAGIGASGLPPKSLMLMPHRVAVALQDDGWLLRNAIVWNRPNAMPESVTDRLSTRYEMLFLFSKSRKYWFDLDPIREDLAYPNEARSASRAGVFARGGDGVNTPHRGFTKQGHDNGRNPGDVWTINTQPFPGAHFATYPPELVRRCIVAGCKPGGTVLDPFHGSGTTGMVAQKHGRKYVGIELKREYLDLSLRTRLANAALDFEEPA